MPDVANLTSYVTIHFLDLINIIDSACCHAGLHKQDSNRGGKKQKQQYQRKPGEFRAGLREARRVTKASEFSVSNTRKRA